MANFPDGDHTMEEEGGGEPEAGTHVPMLSNLFPVP